MRHPQFASRNLHNVSRRPRWLGKCSDCNVRTPFNQYSKSLMQGLSVPCYFTSSIAIQTKTLLSTYPRIIPRWCVYYPSVVIKFPDRYPKATLQSVWFQGGRIHRRLLRRLPRPAVTDVKKCVPFTATPLNPQTHIKGVGS